MKTQFFMFIILSLFFGTTQVQGQIRPFLGKSYEFPVVPGTEAWQKLESHDAMLRATEIPDSVLQQMSTDDLLATALNYPLRWDAFAFDNLIIGTKTVAQRSSIFQELFSRRDISEKSLAFYQTLNPENFQAEWSDVEKGIFSLDFMLVESLLAQPAIFKNFTAEQSTTLLLQIQLNQSKMQLHPDLFGGMSRAIPTFLTGKMLLERGHRATELTEPAVREFLQGRFNGQPTENVLATIQKITEQFLINTKN